MTRFVALIRAVNVGGTGRLPMYDLTEICRSAGFSDVRTWLASGNAVFSSTLRPGEIQSELEARLHRYAGRKVKAFIRTGTEMACVTAVNPFADRDPKLTVAVFVDRLPEKGVFDAVRGPDGEEISLGAKEIYIYYPKGMGRSRLNLQAIRSGTARNMNTVAKLAEMSAEV